MTATETRIYPKYADFEIKLTEAEWHQALRLSDEIKGEKWLYSQIAERDIGTPQTVTNILLVACGIKPTESFDGEGWGRSQMMARFRGFYDAVGQDGKRVFEEGTHEKVVELLSLTHLLGERLNIPPYAQPADCSCLEGELQRFWAQQRGIAKWEDIRVTPEVVAGYCTANRLDAHITLLNSHMASFAMLRAEKAYFNS